jgi:hypothetical protein
MTRDRYCTAQYCPVPAPGSIQSYALRGGTLSFTVTQPAFTRGVDESGFTSTPQ